MLKNIIKHFCLITKHKILVFRLCVKAGIPWRGLVHDLSKYSPTEFWESAKYYNGKRSPISICREKNGYSNAWLHHKGRNKHHAEYWTDYDLKDNPYIIIPFKYACELICDQQAAGMAYQGKNWTKEYELGYWNRRKENLEVNDKIKNFIEKVHTEVAKNGIDKTINKKNLKKWYEECVKMKIDENK